jgi:hypothetical protein
MRRFEVGNQNVGCALNAADILFEGSARLCDLHIGSLHQWAALGGAQQLCGTLGIELAELSNQFVEQTILNAQC